MRTCPYGGEFNYIGGLKMRLDVYNKSIHIFFIVVVIIIITNIHAFLNARSCVFFSFLYIITNSMPHGINKEIMSVIAA